MPRGSADTPPLDRSVILVASRDDLVSCTSRAVAVASQALNKLWMGPFFPVDKFAQKVGTLTGPLLYGRRTEEELLQQLEKVLDLGVPVVRYEPSEAVRLFRFGIGHTPRGGTIYVQHPLFTDSYLAPEEFSKTLAREKEAAFRQLASSLGARELRLTSAEARTEKRSFGAKVSIPEAATQVGVKVVFDERGGLVKQVYSRFGPPRHPPRVPDDLRGWAEMDPDLRTMARDRIEGHLLENRLTLEFKQSMGVGGEIAARVAGKGLTASGTFETLFHSVWHFEAEYWPIEAD
ncbi:MAG: hypothetical protein HYZ29_00960 [Myxococcales bacterium]|nr:hypothetical protein [Myxococcales bacterium]